MMEQELLKAYAAAGVDKKLRILRQLQDSAGDEVEDLFRRALNETSAKIRQLALTVLSRRGKLTPEMVRERLRDRSKMVRQAALRLFQQWRDPAYLPDVLPFLEGSDLSLRLLAVEWMAGLGAPARPYLEPYLQDAMFSVREKVRYVLRDLELQGPPRSDESAFPPKEPSKPAEPPPVESLLKLEPAQQLELLQQLLEENGSRIGPDLIRVLETPRWDRRDSIVGVIKQIRNFPTPLLHPMLDHPIWYVRAAAVDILGHFRDPVLLEYALAYANDKNVEVRRLLAQVMPNYGRREEAVLALEKLSIDEHFSVRRAARAALARLRGQAVRTQPPGSETLG